MKIDNEAHFSDAEKEQMKEPLQVSTSNYAWTLAAHLLASVGATNSCGKVGLGHAGFSQVYLSRMGSPSTAVREAAAQQLMFLQRVDYGLNEVCPSEHYTHIFPIVA